jgi:mono/diheme cytochrome c family protein
MSKIYLSSILVLLHICSYGQQSLPSGQYLFETNCVRCHGANGAKGFPFAKELQKSKMEDTAIAKIIRNGKRIMPSFEKKLSSEEISQLVLYVKTLRK